MRAGSGLEPAQTDACDLLPGEDVLWTGRPARARLSVSDAGFAAYLLAGLAVVAVAATQVGGLPVLVRACAVIVVSGVVIQVAAMLIYVLAVRPRLSQRTVYQVTGYRVVVTTGLRTRRSWSAYLDQIGEPVVRRHRDGSEDLALLAGASSQVPDAAFRTGPFSSLGEVEVPVLRSLGDAVSAQQVAVAARRRMLDGLAEVVTLPAELSAGPLPTDAVLDAGERVLWAGRPGGRLPWWFGSQDVCLSVFALAWLACVVLMGAFAVTSGQAAFLIFLVPLAVAGGLYPAVGRVIHRRVRICRSGYVITDRMLIASWRLGRAPVTVQARLGDLLPPVIRGQAIFTGRADPGRRRRSTGWRQLLWPAATTAPPTLIGVADAPAVRDLIAAAQLALRAAAQGAENAQPTPAKDLQ